jgi:hypothetical protein
MIHSDDGRNAIQGRISVYRLNEGIVEFSMTGSIILWGSLTPQENYFQCQGSSTYDSESVLERVQVTFEGV